ncbi:MAG: isochorismatase family protein [Planctomycetota bacterium]|nr:isochorismatase family protein [Planctomycetota bacterium]MDA1250988.1 isochorismatase family protein [Planctomycetota bacterium]
MKRHLELTSGLLLFTLTFSSAIAQDAPSKPLELTLRSQSESSAGSGRFHIKSRQEKWKPEETAIIVCDVWDLHHCLNAVRRLEEFAPRLDAVLSEARARGVTIIHSPSDCMPAYEKHAARARAIAAPTAAWIPHEVGAWCSVIPTEERAAYPIDQSDGGEDDDPEEHSKWAAQLKALGRNPGTPWKTQSDLITIDGEKDFVSDRGDEVWNVLESRGIRNVILTGVHLNMCVLGRPFGLRQMSRNGKNVVLMRDLTDTMYSPKRWPFVSHNTATDLVVSHVERFVCPTVTSDQLLGGVPFRFKEDKRPHLVIVMAEAEYETNATLPEFALEHLGGDFRVTTVFGSDDDRNSIPNFSAIKDADAVLISVRRRVLPEADLKILRDFVAAGKPVIGIRTASHAFSLNGKEPPEGFSDWPEFDAEVFGGSYHGHLGNSLKSTVEADGDLLHPILRTLTKKPFDQGYSLYNVMPLAKGTTVLARGKAAGHPVEPVAWTFQRADGGRSFYTSLGHPMDFARPPFQQLLLNGIHWACGLPQPPVVLAEHPGTVVEKRWVTSTVPPEGPLATFGGARLPLWLRCIIRVPNEWKNEKLIIDFGSRTGVEAVFLNGKPGTLNAAASVATLPAEAFESGEANLVTLRMKPGSLISSSPSFSNGNFHLSLSGTWQARLSDDDSLANMPLPSKFGGATDIVFSPEEPLWVARPVTLAGEFTGGIEGPACDAEGNIFAVNFGRQGTIGRVTPRGVGGIFVTLPEGSVGNGIRFDKDGAFFVADYARHSILRVDPQTKEITTLAHNPKMNQPNDLAIGPDGTLWASDPNWGNSTGQIWRIDRDGKTTVVAPDMGTTNGIEVSPDGKTLYVNESAQRNIWAFTITKEKTLTDKRLFKKFEDHGFDGHRCDVDGNLYVTRYGKGTVVKLSPAGEILQEINVLGKSPSNLCFGGPDGRTIYVTEVESTRLVAFRVDKAGASYFQLMQ